MGATYTIPPGHRCDWWQIVTDLQMHMPMTSISETTGIPLATLAGYKNLNVEPKHADGERLLGLWRQRMLPPLPTREATLRQERVTK